MNFALISLKTILIRNLDDLAQSLNQWENLGLSQVSSVYRKIDDTTEGTFSSEVAVVLSLQTELDLPALQRKIQNQKHNSSVSCELLTFNHEVRLDPQGPLPHPDLHQDALILRCAAEIQGDFEHPVLGRSLQELVKSSQSIINGAQFEFLARGESLLTPLSEA